jgi:hypothetical protein
MSPPIRTGDTLDAAEAGRLDARLEQLRRDMSLLAAPPALEAQLMKSFAAHHRPATAFTRWRQRLGESFAPGVALAASVGMTAWLLIAPTAPTVVAPKSMRMATDDNTPFIALQSIEQIALEPKARVVHTTVPRMMLASYGVPVSPEVAGDVMRAEMLVSADGQPLAMRFIP